jgi:hypothetical protein
MYDSGQKSILFAGKYGEDYSETGPHGSLRVYTNDPPKKSHVGIGQ